MKKSSAKNKMEEFEILFHKIVNKTKQIEQRPRHFGTDFVLYPSEIHTIEAIGRNAGVNITDLAGIQGVTKGAVSQLIQKLVKKGMVVRMKDEMSDREVLLKLSPTGMIAFKSHEDFHSNLFSDLVKIIEQADDEKLEFMETVFKTIDRSCNGVLNKFSKA